MSSFKIIPSNDQVSNVSTTSHGPRAPSAPALTDALRSGAPPERISSRVNNRHPLETRITQWEQTQRDTQLEMYRRIFGSADPIKRQMDLNLVEESNFKSPCVGNSGLTDMHRDILLNKESSLDWEDIYRDEMGNSTGNLHGGNMNVMTADFHSHMEKKFGF